MSLMPTANQWLLILPSRRDCGASYDLLSLFLYSFLVIRIFDDFFIAAQIDAMSMTEKVHDTPLPFQNISTKSGRTDVATSSRVRDTSMALQQYTAMGGFMSLLYRLSTAIMISTYRSMIGFFSGNLICLISALALSGNFETE
jgi:hypothetical protein